VRRKVVELLTGGEANDEIVRRRNRGIAGDQEIRFRSQGFAVRRGTVPAAKRRRSRDATKSARTKTGRLLKVEKEG